MIGEKKRKRVFYCCLINKRIKAFDNKTFDVIYCNYNVRNRV